MKFFLADSQDLVDPSFDFETETRSETRLRQRDDQYVHEVFGQPPLDGVLISKAIVDGCGSKTGKYTTAQRHRLRRLGAREFFRLDRLKTRRRIDTMGDCGGFSYVEEEAPPYTVQEVLEFYSDCRVDYGISVDHVILDFDAAADKRPRASAPKALRHRQELTLDLARDFLRASRSSAVAPVGVAQGWSPRSYAEAVAALQKIGYRYIAVGGMVPLRTNDILAVLQGIECVRRPPSQLHLLGITRCESVNRFASMGVVSLDSTSPLLQAFKDGEANYHTASGAYMALRVPQADGNTTLRKRIAAGAIDQKRARTLESTCLRELRSYDAGKGSVASSLDALLAYEFLVTGSTSRAEEYRRSLESAPWKHCTCDICKAIGIEVIIFRGSERNKRRGFHNISVFYHRLKTLRRKSA